MKDDESRTDVSFVGSHNPELSSLRVLGNKNLKARQQFFDIVRRAFEANNGEVVASAMALNVGRTTLRRWLDDHSELQQMLAEARQNAIDMKLLCNAYNAYERGTHWMPTQHEQALCIARLSKAGHVDRDGSLIRITTNGVRELHRRNMLNTNT